MKKEHALAKSTLSSRQPELSTWIKRPKQAPVKKYKLMRGPNCPDCRRNDMVHRLWRTNGDGDSTEFLYICELWECGRDGTRWYKRKNDWLVRRAIENRDGEDSDWSLMRSEYGYVHSGR